MTIEERLAALERQNRWLRRCAAIVLAAAAFVLLTGQAKDKAPPDLEVGSLTLKDGAGRERAALRIEKGAPWLFLIDENGTPRARLGGIKSSALALSDAEGRIRLTLGVIEDGSPGLALHDDKGVPRMTLTAAENGCLIFLRDSAGHMRACLRAWNDVSKLELMDGEENVIWSAPK